MIGISHVDISLVHHCVFGLLIDRHSEVIIHDFWAAGERPTEAKLTDGQVFTQAKFLEPRIRLAQDRLLFAHKLFQHGPGFAHHLLHIGVTDPSSTLDQWTLCGPAVAPVHPA
jgi:hypothetical protein